MSILYLYDASAGAGKTHALVSYYIVQLLKKPDDFSRILAITFTNKATQEMRERILVYLDHLTQCRSSDLAKKLQSELGCGSAELVAKAQRALGNILHHYHDFAVTTIDSFFDRMIRAFQREHGLGVAFTLELDEKSVLRVCLEEMIATLSDYPSLRRELIQWGLRKLQEGVRWDLGKEIITIGHDMLKRLAAEVGEEEAMIDPAAMDTILDGLIQKADLFRQGLCEQAGRMMDEVKSAGLSIEDFSWGSQGVVGFLEKVAQGKLLIPSKRVIGAVKGRWEKKQGERAAMAHDLVATRLRPMLLDWLNAYHEGAALYHTVQAMLPLRYALSLAQRMQQLVKQYENEHDQLLMAHLPWLLDKTIQDVGPAQLFWKMGSQYDLFLIDELQDVSRSQWRNLLPLLQAGLAHDRASLLVGDVKQSIYRWRGGDPVIFLRGVTEDLGDDVVRKKALAYNWRSGEEIVHFNNQFFEEASEAVTDFLIEELNEVASADQESIQKEIRQIKQAYQHVKQAIPKREMAFPAGCVEVVLLPTKREEDLNYHWKKEAIARTIQKIEELQEHGYAPEDIALLVRDHAEAQSLLKGLMAYQAGGSAKKGLHYEATMAGGLAIHERSTIVILIGALRYLVDPTNRYVLATLQYYYQLQQLGEEPSPPHWDWHTYFGMDDNSQSFEHNLPRAFYEEMDRLKHMPLDVLVVKLILLFDLKREEVIPYLATFQEVVHDFVQGQKGGIHDFLAWWDHHGKQVQLASQGGDHMKIMTIHQSKGLAFQAVLLPFCAWRLDHAPYHPPMLWCPSEDSSLSALGKIPIYYGKQLKETLLAPCYYQEKWRAYLEQLNLLYVAFTRAVDYLCIISPANAQANKLVTVADVVQKWMRTSYKMGSDDHLTLGCMTNKKGKQQAGAPADDEVGAYGYTLDHQNQLLMSLSPLPYAAGVWWHTFLAAIQTRNDVPHVLATYQAQDDLGDESLQKIETTLTTWWEDERIASWFSDAWEIKIEAPILLPNGDVVRPDRVMVRHDEAVVLDFKTGIPKKADEEQVRMYVTLLRQMGYNQVRGYLLYISTSDLVPVVS